MLEGKNVDLRIIQREDLVTLQNWDNQPKVMGEYQELRQETRDDLEKTYDSLKDAQWFFVQKKDGKEIGYVAHYMEAGMREIGYFVVPDERRKGFVSEAIRVMVDYLFLSRDVVRIQAKTDTENVASWKALEKVGFKREGVLRKNFYCRGKWRDDYIYSILREEWKEPKILAN